MRFTKILFTVIYCLTCSRALAQKDYKEYGIALVLPKTYSIEAQKMNQKIAEQVPTKNLPNVFHVTLFQGNFTKNKMTQLLQDLRSQHFTTVTIAPEHKIKSEKQRYINWSVKKSEQLQSLHERIVKIASPYHLGALSRFVDSYNDLSEKQRQQVEIHGMAGVLDEYEPHVTLFYFPQENSEIKKIVKKILPPKFTPEFQELESRSIVIGGLGYNGNIEKIFYEIELE